MRQIDKYFDNRKAVDNGKLDIAKGEIHALIGANGAGKSTMMRILCGEIKCDSGEIIFDGKPFSPYPGNKTQKAGIFMIHQELSVIKDLTVAQYIFVGREPKKGLIIDDKQMEKDAKEILKQLDANISPSSYMGDLSVAEQQLVEISKALTYDLKLLILDEPTTAFGERETKKLFKIISSLKEQGISIIYISHRLDELFEISDRITVMRDGKYIDTLDTAKTTKDQLIFLLTNRELKASHKKKSAVSENADIVLEVKSLSTGPLLKNISFSLKQGEVLGFAGLMGSGRTETARAICGIDPKTSGEIYINGKEVQIRSPKEAVDKGICYVSEDRNGEGVIYNRSIIGNTVLSSLEKYKKGLFLDDQKMLSDTVEYNANLKTKYSDPHAPVSSLSGGNCQKVVIAKWLIKNPQIFIFDEPTKGIDVGAKDEIYQIIAEIVKDGHSVILISSETDELLNNCDRILVLCEGRVTGEMNIEDVTQEKLMKYETGGDENE